MILYFQAAVAKDIINLCERSFLCPLIFLIIKKKIKLSGTFCRRTAAPTTMPTASVPMFWAATRAPLTMTPIPFRTPTTFKGVGRGVLCRYAPPALPSYFPCVLHSFPKEHRTVCENSVPHPSQDGRNDPLKTRL